MKKLILVTLTAFAASWLLSEVRRDDLPKSFQPGPAATRVFVNNGTVSPDDSDIRIVPRNKKERARAKRTPAGEITLAQSPRTPPPSWFPLTELDEDSKIDNFGFRVVVGRVSASEERAKQDLRQNVELAVGDWLAADVPPSWKVPGAVLDRMVESSYMQEVTRNLIEPEAKTTPEPTRIDGLFTLYRAGQKLNFSPSKRASIVGMYHRDLASQRMQRLGGGLALALVTLAVFSGYIKADEATKGYYTNRLRFAAAAGLGVAGTVIYRFLA